MRILAPLRLGLRTDIVDRRSDCVGLKRRFAIAPIPLRCARGAPLRRSRRYDVAQPLDPRRIECIEQDCIESARRRLLESREIETCRGHHPCALRGRNARGGAAEVAAASKPYFNEHQHVAIKRNEIELANAAAPVALHDHETVAGEEQCGQRLGLRAVARAHAQGDPAGTARPLLNCSARLSRVNCRVASSVRWPVAPSNSMRSVRPTANS